MDETSRYAVGLDVGTKNVRAVVLSVSKSGELAVVGYNEGASEGMRKGVVVNLNGPARAIDRMLLDVEHMSGQNVSAAYVSTNGSQLLTTKTDGLIAVGTVEHEIDFHDLERVEDVAVVGRIPANRTVLDVVPLEYSIDGQRGIKDPVGMSGARLEVRTCVYSALTPNVENLKKAMEQTDIYAKRIVPSVVAAAKAVLTERQKENGVAVVDFGATTTSVAVYEEGDLQYVGVVPAGSDNITNDLAIVLAIEPDFADELKNRFVTGDFKSEKTKVIKITRNKIERAFDRDEVDNVVKARLDDIFGEVRKLLKSAHYDQRLPEGIVLVGGGAKMRDVDVYAREVLEAAVKIGVPTGLNGVADKIATPEYAAAIGLAMMDAEENAQTSNGKRSAKKKDKKPGDSFLKKIFSKF